MISSEGTARHSKQSSTVAHRNADEVFGLLQVLENYKKTLDNTVELNQKLMKDLRKNNK